MFTKMLTVVINSGVLSDICLFICTFQYFHHHDEYLCLTHSKLPRNLCFVLAIMNSQILGSMGGKETIQVTMKISIEI